MGSEGEAKGARGKDEGTWKDMGLVGPVDLSVGKASCSRQETGAHGQNVGMKRKQVGGDSSRPRDDAVSKAEGRGAGVRCTVGVGFWGGSLDSAAEVSQGARHSGPVAGLSSEAVAELEARIREQCKAVEENEALWERLFMAREQEADQVRQVKKAKGILIKGRDRLGPEIMGPRGHWLWVPEEPGDGGQAEGAGAARRPSSVVDTPGWSGPAGGGTRPADEAGRKLGTPKEQTTREGSRCTSTVERVKERGLDEVFDGEVVLELDYEDASDEWEKGEVLDEGKGCQDVKAGGWGTQTRHQRHTRVAEGSRHGGQAPKEE
ncbi:hypothetical protein NDU88_003251 [Pleurodeles waltl]|uniref:Uncharacterized protein n=1 Tax=Pleurodeles waltl TaxID=8319 RepID=A0AAV7QB82_PLEWA|nr:hypothetical protein NDU88_003251 [Pleurodeles waltl]